MNTQRRAMTMVEMIIALTLFSAVMIAVLQTLVSTTNYVEFDASRTDLQTESMQFQNLVTNDFANTSWFYQYDPVTDCSAVDPITFERLPPLYPLVSSDRSSVEFLKLRTSMTVAETPAEERYAFTNFRDPSTRPVDFTQYADAVPTPLMVMNPNYVSDPQWFVAPVWESKWDTSLQGLDFDDNHSAEKLRHYLYTVEADQTGTRNLVRKYLNGYTGPQPPAANWRFDEILLRDVANVQFSTIREDTNLNQNQIKISVFLERTPAGSASTGVMVKRRIDFTAAMRSINQEN